MATIVANASGGTRNWNDTATWTGGVVPTSTSDVQLKSTSGAVTLNASLSCRSLDCTGYTNTLTHNTNVTLTMGDATAGLSNIALKLVSGMTYTKNDVNTSAFAFASTSATQQTIDSGGKTLGNVTIQGTGANYILAAALTINTSAAFRLNEGTFDTGNFTCTWGQFLTSAGAARTLNLGSSTINLMYTSGSIWAASVTTVNAGTSNIVINSTSASTRNFDGGGATYYNLTYTIANSSGVLALTGNNTFNNFTVSDASSAKTITFPSSGTQTFNGFFTADGRSGFLTTIQSSSGTTTLSKAYGATLYNFLYILSVNVTGGASWWYSTAGGAGIGAASTGWLTGAVTIPVSYPETGAFTDTNTALADSVTVDVASITATANNASVTTAVTPAAGLASITATANNATVAETSAAALVSITDITNGASCSVGVSTSQITIAAAVYDAIITTVVMPAAGSAEITGLAYSSASSVAPAVSAVSVTDAANSATANVAASSSACDTVAVANGAVIVTTAVGLASNASVTVTSLDAVGVVAATGSAEVATGTSTVYGAAVVTAVIVPADTALVIGTGIDAVGAVASTGSASLSTVSSAVFDATVTMFSVPVSISAEGVAVATTVPDAIGVTSVLGYAGTCAITSASFGASVVIAGSAITASATGAAFSALCIEGVTSRADAVFVTVVALNAAVTVTATGYASASCAALNASGVVAAPGYANAIAITATTLDATVLVIPHTIVTPETVTITCAVTIGAIGVSARAGYADSNTVAGADIAIGATTSAAVSSALVNVVTQRLSISAGYAVVLSAAWSRSILTIFLRAVYHLYAYEAIYQYPTYTAVYCTHAYVAVHKIVNIVAIQQESVFAAKR
jgi:hypothetical protein